MKLREIDERDIAAVHHDAPDAERQRRLRGLPEAQHDDLAHARGSMAQGDSSANGACSQREPIPLQRARAASMAAGSSNFRASQKSVSSSPRPHFRASEAAFSSIPERNNFPRSVCMYSPTFKAAPHDSVRAFGEGRRCNRVVLPQYNITKKEADANINL